MLEGQHEGEEVHPSGEPRTERRVRSDVLESGGRQRIGREGLPSGTGEPAEGFENASEARSPSAERFDVARLREALGSAAATRPSR